MTPVLDRLRGGLVVSCQAYPGEPMRDPGTMSQVALSVARGGAAGIRAQGLDDIRAIRADVNLPLVGLWKDGDASVRITPTLRHAVAVAEAGADIVAVDGTRRSRPDRRSLAEVVRVVHDETDALIMADVSTYEEGVDAQEAGADVVSTTLSGYTPYSTSQEGPDLELVGRLSADLTVPVVAEGRIHRPEQAAEALRRGAFAVVVGTAITHPATLTSWFAVAVREA